MKKMNVYARYENALAAPTKVLIPKFRLESQKFFKFSELKNLLFINLKFRFNPSASATAKIVKKGAEKVVIFPFIYL